MATTKTTKGKAAASKCTLLADSAFHGSFCILCTSWQCRLFATLPEKFVKVAKTSLNAMRHPISSPKHSHRSKLTNSIHSLAKSSPKDTKAKTAKKAALQGAHSHSSRKTRYSVSFHRPKTLRLPREPKYPRKSIPHVPRMDQFRTIVS